MTAFLDTSAVFKLYHDEPSSAELQRHLQTHRALLISDLTRIEFATTTWKKVRSPRDPAFDAACATTLQQRFFDDVSLGHYIEVKSLDVARCLPVLNRCNMAGYKLRTLDAIQLSCALKVTESLDEFITFDRDLKSAAGFCGLRVPNL